MNMLAGYALGAIAGTSFFYSIYFASEHEKVPAAISFGIFIIMVAVILLVAQYI